jgi:hypothetical protein
MEVPAAMRLMDAQPLQRDPIRSPLAESIITSCDTALFFACEAWS